MKKLEIRTRRLVLRPIRVGDYRAWFDAFTGHLPAKNRWDIGPRTIQKCSRDRFLKLIQKYRELEKRDETYWFGVFEKRTGGLIGHIDFWVFARQSHHFANFGYVIYNRHRGFGYGQEAARAGLKIGFKGLKLNRLEAAINLDNKKSIRLAKAIGMRREGIKKRYWYEFGHWVDHLIYVANPEDLGLRPQLYKS